MRRRFSFANVMAALAVFITLGGTSFAAAGLITGERIKDSSVTGADIKDWSLSGADVKNGSLTGRDIKDGSLSPLDINGSLQGPAGPAGPVGPAGLRGLKGDAGAAGAAGATGTASAFGATGATGPAGAAGAQGIQGVQGFQGLAGNDGAPGPQGPAGPVGATGAAGAEGLAGATGAQGSPGANGTNGAAGPVGPTGPAGPFPGTLPSGATITGAFSLRTTVVNIGDLQASGASFGFALGSAPAVTYVTGSPTVACAGSAANPTAASGQLCIYEAASSNVTGTPCVFDTSAAVVSCGSASRYGFGLQVAPTSAAAVSVWGTWAVTG